MVIYREATLDDLSAICALGEQVNAIHHAAWPHIFAPSGEPDRDSEVWAKGIAVEAATTFLADDQGKVLGFVSVAFIDETNSLLQPVRYAKINSISVAARNRGQGIGRELMAQAEAWAVRHGATDVRLNVWAFNESARAMYQELGYEVRSHMLGKRLSRDGA